jgi:mannose-1-phosphate guanylyltransferase
LTKDIDVARKGYIVTLGITPGRPETGYGYIQIKSKIKNQKSKIYKVDRFIEKPNLKKAKEFLKDKRYYWNAGIFIFRASLILEEIKRFLPQIYKLFKQIKNNQDLNRLWHRLPSVSIDYAIMQESRRIALIPADFGWLDVGSWKAVEGVMKKNKDGNILKGNAVSLDCKNILVWAEKRLVATVGLKNTIVVDTKDAVLVCRKDKAEDVKRLVRILKQKKFRKQL